DQRIRVDAAELFLTHRERHDRDIGCLETRIAELLVERYVRVAVDRRNHRGLATGRELLDVGNNRLVVAVAERRVFLVDVLVRDTDVQQPNTAATLSCEINCRAFSANSGQFDAGSTTTGSSFLPRRPPLALISSIVINATSFKTVSLMAIVPDSECSTPTLIVS